MKKILAYFFMCSLIVACNNASQSTANDGTAAVIAPGVDTTANQNEEIDTDTTVNKSVMHINAEEVPGAVTSAFNSKYPGVNDARWLKAERKGKTFYKVRWKTGDKKMMAAFAENGRFVREKQLN